jgi:hypothetical protein
MRSVFSVIPIQTKHQHGRTYDAIIATVGYETRARNIAEVWQPQSEEKHAFGFKKQQVHSYRYNHDWFEGAGFHVKTVDDLQFAQALSSLCHRLDSQVRDSTTAPISILVDISSVTRSRLAIIIEILRDEEYKHSFAVEFAYTLAKYNPPPKEVPLNTFVAPVTPSFAGWTIDPNRGVAAIVGLGYEEDKALGAVEHVQAVEIWAYAPLSEIAEYDSDVRDANKTLLDLVINDHQLRYAVADPLALYAGLESLVYRLAQQRNVVIFPFGPKLFALCALLAACSHPEVAVWRVSAEELEDAADRLPSKFIYGLKVIFSAELG